MSGLIQNLLFPPKYLNRVKLQNKLRGKTILITGASYGIGEATARLLAGKEINLILVARTKEKLVDLKSELELKGAEITLVIADLYKESDLEHLCAFIENITIDVFISNAGKSIRRSIFDSLDRERDFMKTMQLNYHVPVKIILILLKKWQSGNAQIINVSALNVLMPPQPLWAGYQASKSAFDQWIKSVKPELSTNGIKISTLYLPLVKTRMIEPTEVYRNLPAMLPENVAKVIAKRIFYKRGDYKPWWFYLSFPFIIIFHPLFSFMKRSSYRKKNFK